jgi:hypothetical protein
MGSRDQDQNPNLGLKSGNSNPGQDRLQGPKKPQSQEAGAAGSKR